MNTMTVAAAACAILASTDLVAGAASAGALRPGSYNLDGVHSICLVTGGTWYGEDFKGWGGDWMVGVGGDEAIFGNYASGAGNDSMLVRKRVVQWTEWNDSLQTQSYLSGPFTFITAKCSPAPTAASPGNKNPAD